MSSHAKRLSKRLSPATRFAALGSEPRLAILQVLAEAGPAGMTIGAIGEKVGLQGSTLTHHVKLLAHAGLLTQRRSGRNVICRGVGGDTLADLAATLHALAATP